MDTRGIEEFLGGYNFDEKTQNLIEQIKKNHVAGSDVIILCHNEDKEKCKAVADAADLHVLMCIADGSGKLGDGKSVFFVNPKDLIDVNEADIEHMLEEATEYVKNKVVNDKVEKIIANLAASVPCFLERELKDSVEQLEALLDKKDYLEVHDPIERAQRKYEREQMKQRSRFMSKNCRFKK